MEKREVPQENTLWIIVIIVAFASKARVPNLSLTMYIFSISTDEHAPLKFLMP